MVTRSLLASLVSGFLVIGVVESSSSAANAAAPLSLETFVFSSPEVGFGVFQGESQNGDSCTDYVGESADGGVHFDDLVRVTSWNCSKTSFDSLLSSDGHGDLFLYGTQLFVSHDDAKSWSKVLGMGSILDIDSIGRSIWMVRAACTPREVARATTCPVGLVQSTNGGRTWRSLPGPLGAQTEIAYTDLLQTYLVRTSRDSAYLMVAPPNHFDGSPSVAPLWFTTNGGESWLDRQVPCHLGAWSTSFSVAPDGTLMTVCATQPSAGMQSKTVLESTDGGRSWTLKSPQDARNSDLDAGYLGSVDLLSKENAFLVGDRSSLLETRDGGAVWRAVQPLIGSTAGGTSQIKFFNGSDGLVLGNDDNNNERLTLWSTVDGGAHWKVVIPKYDLPSNDDSVSKGSLSS